MFVCKDMFFLWNGQKEDQRNLNFIVSDIQHTCFSFVGFLILDCFSLFCIVVRPEDHNVSCLLVFLGCDTRNLRLTMSDWQAWEYEHRFLWWMTMTRESLLLSENWRMTVLRRNPCRQLPWILRNIQSIAMLRVLINYPFWEWNISLSGVSNIVLHSWRTSWYFSSLIIKETDRELLWFIRRHKRWFWSNSVWCHPSKGCFLVLLLLFCIFEGRQTVAVKVMIMMMTASSTSTASQGTLNANLILRFTCWGSSCKGNKDFFFPRNHFQFF
jgi:hypothetical protein